MTSNAMYNETESARHYGRMLLHASPPIRKVSIYGVVVSILLAVTAGLFIGFCVWGW
jgi:hypothetical protein